MLVKELFNRLSRGELSNLALSNEGSGTIVPDQQAKLIIYTNEGLLRIFSRFILIENNLIIETLEHITNYPLRYKYAESSNSDELYPFIKDLPNDPFEDDVLKILEVWSREKFQYPLNDKNDPRSLFTPQPDILQIPTPRPREIISVIYQARHPLLKSEAVVIVDQKIDLPFFLEGALQSYVASKVFSHMNGQDNMVRAQDHMQMYESICFDIEQRDMVSNTFHTTHHKLEDRGFC